MTMQDYLTLTAVIVALILGIFGPYIVEWWRKRFEKSVLVVLGDEAIIINQQNFYPDPDSPPIPDQVGSVVRLAIMNNGNFKAKSVEANIEEIEWGSEKRKDFIPMPLLWTHRGSVRDIYPHQTVYLDFLYVGYNPDLVGDQEIVFAVAVGQDVDTLSRLNPFGESKILIKLYQESGQVIEIRVKVFCEKQKIKKVMVR